MVPIAKAALVTLLIGCGATGTFALANGGFGIGTATENSNEQGSDVTPASPEVANTAGGNTQEIVPGPEAGTAEIPLQVRQGDSPSSNEGNVGEKVGTAVKDETLEQPQSQNQNSVPPSTVGNDGLQVAQTLAEETRRVEASNPVAPGGLDTHEETSLNDGHRDPEVTTDEGEGNTVAQQQANAGQEATDGKQSEDPTKESAGQTSEDSAKLDNAESDSSLQGKDATPTVQSSQEPETKTDQTATSPSGSNQVTSKPAEDAELADTLDSGISSEG